MKTPNSLGLEALFFSKPVAPGRNNKTKGEQSNLEGTI